jgi:mono/diheme cytochrome c family protein
MNVKGILFFLVLLAVVGVPRATSQDRRSDALLRNTATPGRILTNPYDSKDEARLAGMKLFERHCAECHGDAGVGTADAPSLRTGVVRSAAPGTLFTFLKNGNLRQGMPSWSALPAARVWQIVTYLNSLDK